MRVSKHGKNFPGLGIGLFVANKLVNRLFGQGIVVSFKRICEYNASFLWYVFNKFEEKKRNELFNLFDMESIKAEKEYLKLKGPNSSFKIISNQFKERFSGEERKNFIGRTINIPTYETEFNFLIPKAR